MKEMKEMKEMGNMLRMLQTIDAFFPIGAFTLSNGLEDYVAAERISSTADPGGISDRLSPDLPLQ